MSEIALQARQHAGEIWWAGVEAVQPRHCLRRAVQQAGIALDTLGRFGRILVVGGGKAGAALAEALEALLKPHLAKVSGLVNVPNETLIPLRAIRLHAARPLGINQPTEEALAGAEEMLRIAESAGRNDLMLCLFSGGGSALLPAPVPGVSLADKQQMTRLLHECGATIQEMNAVRKHLSRIKGGGLVRYSNGARSISLLISDVIGDPLDVIASGPTAVDPTTFADAVAVLQKYGLEPRSPANVLSHLRAGLAGQAPETLKVLPLDSSGRPLVENLIIANSEKALEAAGARADELGYVVFENPNVQGDTGQAAAVEARQAQELVSNREHHLWKLASTGRPLCLLSGGETTVVLPSEHGLGGRNQEYVLAFLQTLGIGGMKGITVLSGGTDGEDGPTDAAGAMGDADLLQQAKLRGLDSAAFLARHDAYHFFEPLGGLWKTGPTHTNVMDLRVVLIHPS